MPRGFGFGRRGQGRGRFWCRRFAMVTWFNKAGSQSKAIGGQVNLGNQQFGYGYNRMLKAMEIGDPERAMFGLGPCGELAYQEYKKRKNEGEEKS